MAPLGLSHVLVSMGTAVALYVASVIKNKFFPAPVTPPVVVNVNITAQNPVVTSVTNGEKQELLKG
jgi:hypothetical protein